MFGADADLPEVDISEQRLDQMLGEIKRNSRNRRIAMFAPIVLAAAVLSAMIAAPPQHGGLALADADGADPELPRVFGSNGVWRLAEPIAQAEPADPGPAAVIEAPTLPEGPVFSLTPPTPEEISSLPASTSTPPMSTSGQSPASDSLLADVASEDLADLDWSSFNIAIRIEPSETDVPVAEPSPAEDGAAQTDLSDPVPDDTVPAEPADLPDANDAPQATLEETSSTPALSDDVVEASDEATTTPDTPLIDGDVTVAALPQAESDLAGANPSSPAPDQTDAEAAAFSTPALIVPQSVLVYSAHVSVTVQVVDDDSSVIDWCNTRVDWGDGSVTRIVGADDGALCTAPCEYEATSSASTNINETLEFSHDYAATVLAASPRVFVATGDGCSYTLAEVQLAPFTVVVPVP